MNRQSIHKYSRIWHRKLAVIIGLQFLFWTLGGAYFAWFHIDNVRGNYERTNVTDKANFKETNGLKSIQTIIQQSDLENIKEVSIDYWQEQPVYRLIQDRDKVEMFHAATGIKLSPISHGTAMLVAKEDFKPKDKIANIVRITERGGEYKGPLPAYRVEFDNVKATNVYVHENSGKVTARRNVIWRGFDFLWMLHILDFQDRSDFNNWLLKIMSVLGLITIFSGYLLWASTSTLFRKKRPSS